MGYEFQSFVFDDFIIIKKGLKSMIKQVQP